jgi:DNA modification methylase
MRPNDSRVPDMRPAAADRAPRRAHIKALRMTANPITDAVTLWAGDCLALLPTLAANTFDSCVTDPPYHLISIVKRFGADNAAPALSNGATGVYGRASAGFMGKKWDGGDIAFRPEMWAAVWHVLKPGAHLVAFGGTRTYHRMACAIEDAGFEIRDCIMWLYGSGFPKSHNVSKGIDRADGYWRGTTQDCRNGPKTKSETKGDKYGGGYLNQVEIDAGPITDAAREWAGWGTALKPACEPIVLARKPLSEPTVAANVLKWGTGALNIDGCRVEASDQDALTASREQFAHSNIHTKTNIGGRFLASETIKPNMTPGRWPANVVHDGSDEVVAAFPDAKAGGNVESSAPSDKTGTIFGKFAGRFDNTSYQDNGSAARFFYTAKADDGDRLGSKHPTVKPVDLMQWLVRLVTPRRGLVLDPFAGTGTTAEAALREGMRAVLIEAEPEYVADIRRRLELCRAGPMTRLHESIKARGKVEDPGPLFAIDTYDGDADFAGSYEECLRAVRERKAAGGKGWEP